MRPDVTEQSFWHRGPAAFGKPVCRLGLASHMDTDIEPADILHALGRGVNFLNWAGDAEVFSRTIAGLGPRRHGVIVCVQFAARTGKDAAEELHSILTTLRTDYVDVLTFYYVESADEWRELFCETDLYVYDEEEYARTEEGWRAGAAGAERVLCAELHPGRLRHELVRRLRRAK